MVQSKMTRKPPTRKSFPEAITQAPDTVWKLAVSRLPDEQEIGYESLSLLLLLFESVLDLRIDDQEQEQPEPWIAYRQKMNKPQGKTIECFEAALDAKYAKCQAIAAA